MRMEFFFPLLSGVGWGFLVLVVCGAQSIAFVHLCQLVTYFFFLFFTLLLRENGMAFICYGMAWGLDKVMMNF